MGRAEEFAARHGIPAAYDTVEGLLSDQRVDAVFIASPNHQHAGHTIQAAQAGKHVLVEKPMATDVAEAVNMVRACHDHGVNLGVGYQLRTHPGHIQAKKLIADGVLGTVSMAQAQWGTRAVRGVVQPQPRTGLSAWWDQPEMIGYASTMMGTGVHAIDLLHFLLGERISEVAAISDGQRVGRPLEQVAALCVRFESGIIGTVCCGRRMPDTRNDAVVYGSSGRALMQDSLWETLQGRLEVVSDAVNTDQSYPHDAHGLFQRQFEAFTQAVEQGTQPAATGLDGLWTVQVTSAMIESASTGRTIKIEALVV